MKSASLTREQKFNKIKHLLENMNGIELEKVYSFVRVLCEIHGQNGGESYV